MPFWKKAIKKTTSKGKALRTGKNTKRVLLPFPPKSETDGSMTVEAAMVVPVFLFFIMNVLFIFDMIRLQSNMLAALHETGTQISEYAYYYRYGLSDILNIQAGDDTYQGETGADFGIAEAAASFVLSETYVKEKVTDHLGAGYLDKTCLSGGADSISYAQSQILAGGDNVDLIADYRVRPFIRIPGVDDFSMQNRFYSHAWVGYDIGAEPEDHDKEDDDDPTVYYTASGTVYHCDRGCTYLNPSIRTVNASELDSLRNKGGAKYYPCESCHPSSTGTVLITSEGNRYHSSSTCPGIKRTVYEAKLSEVKGKMPACSKCGGQ